MAQRKSSRGSTQLPKYAIAVGAMTASASGASITFGQASMQRPAGLHGSSMTPQDQDFIMARVDAKMESLRGDVRLNTAGMADLKDRLGDLTTRMANVPADIAAMKRDIAHLPTKDELGTKLRNYLGAAVALVALVNAAIAWGPRLLGQ